MKTAWRMALGLVCSLPLAAWATQCGDELSRVELERCILQQELANEISPQPRRVHFNPPAAQPEQSWQNRTDGKDRLQWQSEEPDLEWERYE